MPRLEATAFFPASKVIIFDNSALIQRVSPARYEIFGFKNAEMFHLDGKFLMKHLAISRTIFLTFSK